MHSAGFLRAHSILESRHRYDILRIVWNAETQRPFLGIEVCWLLVLLSLSSGPIATSLVHLREHAIHLILPGFTVCRGILLRQQSFLRASIEEPWPTLFASLDDG